MNTTGNTANVRPTAVAFVQCYDATTFGRTIYMTAQEERRLCLLLTALYNAGLILRASFAPALPDYGCAEAVADLRSSLGARIVGAFGGGHGPGTTMSPSRRP